jgi:hypothetical protein
LFFSFYTRCSLHHPPTRPTYFLVVCRWAPEDRITPRDASRHPYIAGETGAARRASARVAATTLVSMATPSPLPLVASASPRRASAPQMVGVSSAPRIPPTNNTVMPMVGNGGGRPKRNLSEPLIGLPHSNRAAHEIDVASSVSVIGGSGGTTGGGVGGDGADGRTPMRRQSQIFKQHQRRSLDSATQGGMPGGPTKGAKTTVIGSQSTTSLQRAVPHHLNCSLKVIFDQYS